MVDTVIGAGRPLRVVLRPGAPDTDDDAQLRAKAGAAVAAGATSNKKFPVSQPRSADSSTMDLSELTHPAQAGSRLLPEQPEVLEAP